MPIHDQYSRQRHAIGFDRLNLPRSPMEEDVGVIQLCKPGLQHRYRLASRQM